MSPHALSALVAVVGLGHLVLGWRARVSGVHVYGWGGGALLRGKAVPSTFLYGVGAVVLLGAASASLAVVLTSFSIDNPRGWIDLSERAPSANFSEVAADPSAVRAKLAGAVTTAAVVDEERVTLFEARVSSRPWSPSPEALREIASHHLAALGADASVEMGEFEIVPVQSVPSGRYTARIEVSGRRLEYMAYVLPGRTSHAILAYAAHARDYDHHASEFRAAVDAVRGVALPWPRLDYLLIGLLVVVGFAPIAVAKPPPRPQDDSDDDEEERGSVQARPRRRRSR